MWMFRFRSFLKRAGRDALVLGFALRDPATPLILKAGILLLALYAVSPIDLVPDLLVLFGWVDDLALLMLGVPFLAGRLPASVRERAGERADQLLARFGVGRT